MTRHDNPNVPGAGSPQDITDPATGGSRLLSARLPRLEEIEDNLPARRARAHQEAWLGEVEGIDLTITCLRQKRDQTQRLARIAPADLGMPATAGSAPKPGPPGGQRTSPERA